MISGFRNPNWDKPEAARFSMLIDDYVSEFDSLYNGILANPFDAGARRVFSDWLQDNEADSPYLAALANYPAGEFPAVPSRVEFERWEGPGYIARGAFGTFDTWLGVSGMFVQACRTGLFADMPITTAVICNLAPIDRGSYCYWFANERDQTNTIILLRSILTDLTVVECEQSLINDVYATFMPDDGGNAISSEIGVYRAFNQNSALAIMSDAYVKLGRYACGLPEIDWPERNAVAADHIAGLWRFFRSLYRVDDGLERGLIIDQSGKRLNRNEYGRTEFRNLIPSHVRG